MKTNLNRFGIALFVATVLTACGGGSGGGGGGGGPSYTIGGSVSGLTGSGLVLQNNGSGSLSILNDGDFIFSTSLNDGLAYSVTVSVQPTGQSCAVSNGVGAVSGADVTNVAVVCTNSARDWGTATRIENDAGTADTPRVAIDGLGNAIAIWLQNDGTRDNLVANRYIKGAGWGTPTIIDDDDNDVFIPQITMDSAGNAIAVWRQHDGTRYSLWANNYTLALGWGSAELLESNDVQHVNTPQVAFNQSSGSAIVVWQQGDEIAGGKYIWANHYSVATGWGGATRIEALSAVSASDPQIVVNDTGNAVAVWRNIDGDVRANSYTTAGGWETAASIGGGSINVGTNPQVAIDADGNAISVWEQGGGPGVVSIWSSRYTVGSGWNASVDIEMNEEIAYAPQVAFDATGNATAVWYQNIGFNQYNRIVTNRYSASLGWGTNVQIVSDDTIDGDVQSPQLDIDDTGNAITVYYQAGSGNSIATNRYIAGVGWGTPMNLESEEGQLLYEPDVAVNASGDAVAIWSQRNDTTGFFDIWVNHYQ